MQQSYYRQNEGIISMEEYLNKRQAIKAREQKKSGKQSNHIQDKEAAYMLAELFI